MTLDIIKTDTGSSSCSKDQIRLFLPDIPQEEYDLRAQLRVYRNAASELIAITDCPTASCLAWEVVEWTTPNLYRPAPLEWLNQLNRLAKRLMLTALQVEDMQRMLRVGSCE